MGTRHLIVAIVDGKHRLAQYGQSDGGYQIHGIRKFLATKTKVKALRRALRKSRFISKEAAQALGETWKATHPQLSRDLGAKVLDMVAKSSGMELYDSYAFGGDSLFCEYAYVIDLDNEVLERYKGFNKRPVSKRHRFAGCVPAHNGTSEYTPVRLVRKERFGVIASREVTKK